MRNPPDFLPLRVRLTTVSFDTKGRVELLLDPASVCRRHATRPSISLRRRPMNRSQLVVVATFALALAAGWPISLEAQTTGSRFTNQVRANRTVQDAVQWIDDNYDAQVEEWIRITEIPAKSMFEQERAAYVRAQMEAEGLEVSTDSIGNVTGIRRGAGSGSTIVFAAHMDTVHPLTVQRDGDILRAPGIFDNSASVANMLATIRALNRAGVRTQGDVIFVATVQEELGPVRALAEAVDAIYEVEIPEGRGGAVYNIGMIGGGKIFNGIPQDVFFTIDLRSVNPVLLDSLDAEIESRVAAAATAHQVRWDMERVQHMTAGGTEDQLRDQLAHPVVVTAMDIYESLDIPTRAIPSGSTDGNVGVVRGIPSIAVGRSTGGDQHTLTEYADGNSARDATKAIIYLVAALAGVVPAALIP